MTTARRAGLAATIAIVVLVGASLATSQLTGVGLNCGLGNVVSTTVETSPQSTTYATPNEAASSNDWLDVLDVPVEAREITSGPGTPEDGIREIPVSVVPGDRERRVYLVFVGGDDVIELHVERTDQGRHLITSTLQC